MASSSSCGDNKSYKYNVFLSFSGEDTRNTFVDHLYAALDRQGICTFKDDEKLERGKEINDELLQAIEDSRFYIIIFSKRYASSSWCLNELLKIMECLKTNGHTAFPVFYDVDPSEVRKQTGPVGEALDAHKNKNESEIGRWREALKVAANLSGWDVRTTANGREAKVIELVVECVSLELRPFDMHVDETLIGMEQRMQDLNQYLKIGLKDVRMVGIKGMGGAGKTTLARAIFDKISINFEGISFVENVREKASQLGLEKLQEQVLRDVLKNKGISVSGVYEGKHLMSTRLSVKEVLVVLDDVDCKDQLEMLAGDPTWFKPGSRIIITTRDGEVLEEHNVKWIHDVNLLSKEEAIRLFSKHAFGKDFPTQRYEKHSREVVSYAAGLPLTIKVLGSKLCGKDDRQWKYTLERLKTIPLKETLEKLELSYESLEGEHKEIFLDVVCILKGLDKNEAIRILEGCGYYAQHGLRVLEQKCLISLKDKYRIRMHDHIEEMGKNIVRREHPNDPERHSRLWVQEEIENVLANDLGTEATRFVDIPLSTPEIVLEGLRNMKKLRCLVMRKRHFWTNSDEFLKIDEARAYFPNSLQYLSWYQYPHWCLPKTFEANNLVALEMSHSKIKQLWEGGKVMKKLRFLDLSYTKLRSLDLGLTPNLERLNLERCFDLVKLSVQGGCLKTLVYLNLSVCGSLKSISFIEQLESPEVLYIGGLKLRELPDYIMTGHSSNSLLELHLPYNEDIEEIPSSIGNLHKLVSLDLSSCRSLKSVPGNICRLQHLRTLFLGCNLLEKLPEDVGQLESLETLDLRLSLKLREIPSSICKLKRLKELELQGCWRLEKLPDEMGDLECLQLLNIQKTGITHLPQSISLLKGLKIHKSDDDFIQLCSKYDAKKRQIQGFQQLTTLDLSRCGIEEVPEALGQLHCLEELDLTCTNVKQLPDTICMLKHLKTLFLEFCVHLEKLPDDVGQLESLEGLYLSRCYSLREIPNSSCMLKQLKILDLYHCFCLEKLPEDVGQLESLEDLYLSRCYNIREIPNSICMLKHLKMLDLGGCRRLEKLPDEMGKLECLQELTIWDTGISHLPQSISLSYGLKIYTEIPDEPSEESINWMGHRNEKGTCSYAKRHKRTTVFRTFSKLMLESYWLRMLHTSWP